MFLFVPGGDFSHTIPVCKSLDTFINYMNVSFRDSTKRWRRSFVCKRHLQSQIANCANVCARTISTTSCHSIPVSSSAIRAPASPKIQTNTSSTGRQMFANSSWDSLMPQPDPQYKRLQHHTTDAFEAKV